LQYNIQNAIIVLVLCIIFYAIAGDIIYSFIRAGHSEAEMQSGTGRSVIWEAAYMSFKDNPILGSGFVIGERELGPKYGFDFRQLSAHNAFLSVLVNTGLIGFFIFIRFLYKWGIILYRNSHWNVLSTILLPIYISIVINSAACPSIGSDWGPISSCIYLIIGVSFMPTKKNIKPRPQYKNSK
jgi:exopolysaccharide production protein ExoQ